jgi:hypothetical protein
MDSSLNYLQTFSPAETNPALLEKTLVGRRDLVDKLEELVIESAATGNKIQRLIVGPRGSGKTHTLKVLHNRILARKELQDKLEVSYLCEDEYGVATFLDWLIRIFWSFTRWNPPKANYLNDEIEKLKRTPEPDRERIAKQILLNYINGKTLLIIVENIGNIFHKIKGFGEEGQRKFRDLIQQYPQFTIMASNPALFEEILSEDMPFHNFFKVIHLYKLSLEQVVLFLKSIAEWDKNEKLSQFLDTPEGVGRIRAIYNLIGGNHRLLVTFYEFLKTDFINKLSEPFIKTINDLIPYYQSLMEVLSSQQQKIVQYLSRIRIASTVKDIAENCFILENTASKQMHTLIKLKYVDAIKRGRETFYELSEPLLRICNEVRANRGEAFRLFVDFLDNLYIAAEIKFSDSLSISKDHPQPSSSVKKSIGLYGIEKSSGWRESDIAGYTGLSQIDNSLERLEEDLKEMEAIELTNKAVINFERSHISLFVYGAEQNISRYLDQAVELIEKHGFMEEFWKSVPNTVFEVLRQHEKIETRKFEWIERYLEEKFKDAEAMIVPLKFLNIGIRHLKKKEKNVLFQLAKEERRTFQQFVLDKLDA